MIYKGQAAMLYSFKCKLKKKRVPGYIFYKGKKYILQLLLIL